MKQTAIEWLMYQMLAASINKETEEMHITLPKDVFNQAKEMEKEQIIEAYDKGYEEGYRDNGKFGFVYYNETYKK